MREYPPGSSIQGTTSAPKPAVIGRALIIGYGNPLRGDDGVGPAVADAIAHEAMNATDVVNCHQLTPELAACLATADLVVFVDAGAGVGPGRVVIAPVQCASAPSAGLGHHVDPGMLLGISRTLYGRVPEAFLVTVGACSFEFSEELSEAVTAALPDAIAAVRHLVREQLGGD